VYGYRHVADNLVALKRKLKEENQVDPLIENYYRCAKRSAVRELCRGTAFIPKPFSVTTLACMDNAFVSKSKFGPFILLCRLVDKKAKAKQCAPWIKNLCNSNPEFSGILLRMAYQSGGIWRSNICLDRLKTFVGDSSSSARESYHCVTIKFPQLLCVDFRRIVNAWVRNFLQVALSNRITVKLRVLPAKSVSILATLDNSRQWARKLHDEKLFLCCCKTLTSYFGSGEHDPEKGQHYIARYRSSKAASFLSGNVSVRSEVSPSLRDVQKWASSLQPMLQEKLGKHLLFDFQDGPIQEEIAEIFSTFSLHQKGFQSCWFKSLGERFSETTIFTEIDKGKSDLAICCPCGWFKRSRSAAEASTSPVVPKAQDIHFEFARLLNHLNYVGAYPKTKSIQKRLKNDGLAEVEAQKDKKTVIFSMQESAARALLKHVWGLYRWIPKDSGLAEKGRPLGSYKAHCLKPLYRVASKAIQHICSLVYPSLECSLSFQSVVKSANSWNLSLNGLRDSKRSCMLFPFKFDIDNFFGNVCRSDVESAWLATLQLFTERFGSRRGYVSIPHSKFVKTHSSQGRCCIRSFHELLRMHRLPDNHIVLQNGPLHADDRFCIALKDILQIINTDFAFGVLLLGRQKIVTVKGCCQGSVLSPALCTLTSCWVKFMHSKNVLNLSLPAGWLKSFWTHQWVDDIYGIVCIAVPLKQTKTPDEKAACLELAEHFFDLIRDSYLEPFRIRFGLKCEDHSVFVGLRLSVLDALIDLMPEPTFSLSSPPTSSTLGYHTELQVKRYKFRHFSSCTEDVAKVRLVVSQLNQTCDRTSSTRLLHRAVTNLFCEFAIVGFPAPLLNEALHKFLYCHPYISGIRGCLFSAARLLLLTKTAVCNSFYYLLYSSAQRAAGTSEQFLSMRRFVPYSDTKGSKLCI